MTSQPPSLRPRCDAAIVFAVALEADAFERRATVSRTLQTEGLTLHEGLVSGRSVAWCVAGVGRERAARAARLLLLGHAPRMIMTAGFAGGLAPDRARGAVVRATRVIDEHGAAPIALAGGDTARPATILTVDRIVESAAAKQGLFAATGAVLVDMETFAVAAEAARFDVPCCSLRVISDGAGDTLPREVAALARPQSAMRRLGTALGAIGRRPTAARDMWRLYEHAVVDGKTLATALCDWLAALPATGPEAT